MNKNQIENVSDDREQTKQQQQKQQILLLKEEKKKILNDEITSEKCILQTFINSDIEKTTTLTNDFVITKPASDATAVAATTTISQGTMLPATEEYATTAATTTIKTSTNEATIGTTPNTNVNADIASVSAAVAATVAVSDAPATNLTADAQTVGTESASSKSALENEGQQQLTAKHINAVNEVSTNVVYLPITTAAAPLAVASTSPLQSPSAVLLPHVASEPTFGVQMRTHQQQKIKSYHDAKQTTLWHTESIASNPSLNFTSTNEENGTRTSIGLYGSDNGGGVGSTASSNSSHDYTLQHSSTTVTPQLKRKQSEQILDIKRRVSFPESDKDLVTGCLEPANPWEQVCRFKSVSEIAELYVQSCHKHNSTPLPTVLEHLKVVDFNTQTRQNLLSLKAIKLTSNDCEPLEEIFKRLQYKSIDLSECSLDESSMSALFDMIEYYEAANELDISSNKEGMTNRGWASCTYMIGRSQELQVLNAEGNPISKHSAECLGSALNTSNMHTLKLEHCGLKGAPLTNFCCKLHHNKVLKELWLAYNDLDCTDAKHIADLLRFNNYIELVDISNNNIRDEGMMYLVQALIMQSGELERRSNMRRAAAIEDDEIFSPVESSAPTELHQIGYSCCNEGERREDSNSNSEDSKSVTVVALPTDGCGGGGVSDDEKSNVKQMERFNFATKPSECNEIKKIVEFLSDELTTQSKSKQSRAIEYDNEADDDTTENTMCTPNNAKSNNQNINTTSGQSMLDKLLSMNSDSSSDDGPSIISTDTLAACGSEDISVISDEIYDAAPTTATTNTSTNIRSTLAPTMTSTTTTATAAASILAAAGVAGIPSSSLAATMAINETDIKMTTKTTIPKTLAAAGKLKQDSPTEICDINNLTEAKNIVGANINCSQNSSNSGSKKSSNNNNNNSNNNTITNSNSNSCDNSGNNSDLCHTQNNSHLSTPNPSTGALVSASSVFEVTAEESDCINGAAGGATRPLDMNKNMKIGEDYEDTHSTDSAFESASEGDISRHLPDEFNRLSTSLESTRLDDMTKEIAIETATIATESTECLAMAEEAASTPTPSETTNFGQTNEQNIKAVTTTINADDDNVFAPPTVPPPPKVTIAADCLTLAKEKECSQSPNRSPVPTPPPPSTSLGGVSSMRRTESTISYLNQSTRNHSHSSDSLCSENSLDGSTTSNDHNFAEKLTKNDTLSRRHLIDTSAEATHKSQSGLKALTVWSNNLTKKSGDCIAELLEKTVSLELLNVGKNCLSNDFVDTIKDSLIKNTTLTTLGLQSAHLSAKGIETLASILTFGGNSKLQRIDIRDNKIEVESLNTIAEVLKSNKTITQIDINDEPKRLTLPIVPIVNVTPPTPLPQDSIGSDAHLDYARVLENVRSMCSRNEKIQTQLQAERSANLGGSGSNYTNSFSTNRCRGGYYLGSRKISLTCHSRPLVDAVTGTIVGSSIAVSTASPTPVAKLEVKRKTGVRLRSPVPSPPTVSPSSSPNRSRFQVSRVQEVSPLTSPLAQIPPSHPPIKTTITSSSCVSIPTATASATNAMASLPTSSSLPAMASATSSTQTIRRLTVNPRSRFHVSRIYEDLQVPVTNRAMPPITPPLNPPPTPMLKSARKAAQMAAAASATAESSTETTTVLIVEPPTTSTTTAAAVITTGAAVTTPNVSNLSPQAVLSSSSSSSSSTTSPISLNSNSSVTSSSSPPSSATSSSSPTTTATASSASTAALASSNNSSNSSTGTGTSNASTSLSDSTDSSLSVTTRMAHDMPKICPIAVFGDNDITLTKESAITLALSNNVAQERIGGGDSTSPGVPTTTEAQQQHQQRSRKSSWIAPQSTVDKLLTLFNTSTIFQRSASPEPKSGGGGGGGGGQCAINNELSSTLNVQQQQQLGQQQQQQQSALVAVATRKTTPPSWTKFSSNEHNISGSGGGGSSGAGSGSSFLDVASRQFRDLSKQVFRPNISFGNDGGNTTPDATPFTTTTATAAGTINSGGCSGNSNPLQIASETTVECDVAHMPTNLKRELKENISPEHTINEETLHSLQKLAKFEEDSVAVTTTAAGALEPNDDIGDIEIVTHDELIKDCCKIAASATSSRSTTTAESVSATSAVSQSNTVKEQEIVRAAQNT